MHSVSPNVAPTNRPNNINYSVIIPAAGVGNRMKSYGPKALLGINGTTILENQLTHINTNLPQSEIIVVVGFEGPKIERKLAHQDNVKIVYNDIFATTNVVYSIALGLKAATYNDVIIIYGDLVFNVHALRAPFGAYSLVLVDTNGFMDKGEVGCLTNGHVLERMMYTFPIKWAQIAYFCGKELELLRKICRIEKYYMYFGFEAINIIVNSGGLFTTYTPKDMKVMDVDSSKHLERTKEIIV